MKMARTLLLLISLLSLTLWGCGGGGGGSSDGRSAPVNVFVTDSFRDDYDHVWVTLYKVELVDAGGGAQTLFDDAEGRVIDLRTLRDQTGERFAFLSTGNVTPGTYTAGRITVGDTFNLIPKGAGAAQSLPVDQDVPRDAQGRPVVTFSFQSPHAIGPGGEPLVIDFDLANFAVINGRLRPAIRHALTNVLGELPRHEDHRLSGILSELSGTAPNLSFLLTLGNGEKVHVATSESTAIFNADGSPNAALANGQRVKVGGVFDVGGNRLVASEIKIEVVGEQSHRAFVAGKPLNINASAGTFDVLIRRAEGFVPTHDVVHIVTTAETVFRTDSGMVISAADFFAGLATADEVRVEGTYDVGSNTITAHSARLVRFHDAEHRVKAEGAPKEINAEAGTFIIRPITQRDGFVPPGDSVNVVTNGNTKFVDHHGNQVSRSAFFELLRTAHKVRVEGVYNASTNTITASLARILDQGEHHHPASAIGKPVEINREARTFILKPVYEHSGFDFRDDRVKVATNAQTVFKGKNGDILTAAAFFELLLRATRVRVEGDYDEGTNTILASVAHIVELEEEHHPATAVGKPVEISREARTFWLDPVYEHTGFDVRDGRVKVITNANTVYKGKNGETLTAAAFFDLLPRATRVRVEGDYSADTNAITAEVARIVEIEEERQVSAKGAPKEIRAGEKTFDINPVTEHTGFDPPDNRVHVVATANTVYKNREGQTIGAGDFFELLSHADRVRVEGTYRESTNTITAAIAAISGP